MSEREASNSYCRYELISRELGRGAELLESKIPAGPMKIGISVENLYGRGVHSEE